MEPIVLWMVGTQEQQPWIMAVARERSRLFFPSKIGRGGGFGMLVNSESVDTRWRSRVREFDSLTLRQ